MKSILCSVVVALSSLSFSQLEIGKPTAVAVGVADITWEPTAKALSFNLVDSDGTGKGLYNTETGKSKIVFRPGAKTVVQELWMNGRPVLIDIFDEPIAGRDTIRTSIWAFDAVNMTAKELFGAEHKKEEGLDLNFEVSPSRPHAIVVMTISKKRLSYVITEGPNGMIFSPDLTKATESGVSFLGWSVDGTAYYSNSTSIFNGVIKAIPATSDGKTVELQTLHKAEIEFKVALDRKAAVTDGHPIAWSEVPVESFKVRFFMRPINPGESVFELMPGNGSLRPIKAKGGYNAPAVTLLPVSTEMVSAPISFGISKGESTALWLVLHSADQNSKSKPDTSKAVLVTSNASTSWIAENQKAIAYLTDGALFVRTINRKSPQK